MKKRPLPQVKQPTPDELLASLLEFVERHFYAGHPVAFAKDRRRILDWVILWPAAWLNNRGVTVPAARYGEIVRGVLMDALRFGRLEEITYLPAWLKKVLQSHFALHGDEIYAEAKAMRNLVEHALVVAGRHVQAEPDAVKELAATRRLLNVAKGRKRPVKRPVNDQLTFL